MSNLSYVKEHINQESVLEAYTIRYGDKYKAYVNFGSDLRQNSGRSDNGGIPHIHIDINGKPYSCIRLDKPEYFIHQDYRHELRGREKRRFLNFIQSEYTGNDYTNIPKTQITNWEYFAYKWNTIGPIKFVDIGAGIPDYSDL